MGYEYFVSITYSLEYMWSGCGNYVILQHANVCIAESVVYCFKVIALTTLEASNSGKQDRSYNQSNTLQ